VSHEVSAPATVARLRRDVEALCVTPRHRDVPGSLEAARAHCRHQLEEVGWSVEERPFRPRPALRYSDAGHPTSPLAMRWLSGLVGVNLLAFGPGRDGPQAGDTLLIAHLDTVRSSVGADDNASGVAVALEVARQLGERDHRVVIALVDLEELMHLGARELARTLPRPGLAVVLDAVGYFDDRPGSQRMPPGFGVMFPRVARQLKGTERRGDFLLAVHRRSSESFARAWEHAATAAGLPAVLLRDRRWNGRGQGFTRYLSPLLIDLDRSDHAPFWRRRIPAVFMTATATMRSPNYHRDTDTPATVDYERLSRVAASLRAALAG
jgi:Zn-dependent M28 family amino/carboxypeptidase